MSKKSIINLVFKLFITLSMLLFILLILYKLFIPKDIYDIDIYKILLLLAGISYIIFLFVFLIFPNEITLKKEKRKKRSFKK